MINPVGNRVLVEPIKQTQDHIGRIVIPESVMKSDAPAEGIVVKLGTGKPNKKGIVIPFEVKEGDRVFYNRYTGQDIKSGRKMFKLLEPSEILAVIE